MKTIENYFTDWEQETFGLGYGSGEEFITPAIKKFLNLCPIEGNYDFKVLEGLLTSTIAWLLITAFIKAEIIEYGTSPRYGWLTKEGQALREFMTTRTDEELIKLSGYQGEDYVPCYSDVCNCDDGKCHNPFWIESKSR